MNKPRKIAAVRGAAGRTGVAPADDPQRAKKPERVSAPRFALTLQAVPGWGDVPVIIRLRKFLKAALRAWGLRCIRCEEIPAEPAAPTPATKLDEQGATL
jgi:hypothetical protein